MHWGLIPEGLLGGVSPSSFGLHHSHSFWRLHLGERLSSLLKMRWQSPFLKLRKQPWWSLNCLWAHSSLVLKNHIHVCSWSTLWSCSVQSEKYYILPSLPSISFLFSSNWQFSCWGGWLSPGFIPTFLIKTMLGHILSVPFQTCFLILCNTG